MGESHRGGRVKFPMSLAGRTWKSGPELVGAVVADSLAGGGTVVEGRQPAEWLSDCVRDGTLPIELAVGLVAALLQSRKDPPAVVQAADLARRLRRPELAELLVLTLEALDVGYLLEPANPDGQSVEDALLRAAVATLGPDDHALRGRLLAHLRNAGLPGLEAELLLRHGTAEEIRAWLPNILTEGFPDAARPALEAAWTRDDAVAAAVRDVIG